MKTKKVTRYYCDHCGKGGFRKPDMLNHESTCNMNPHRACYLCELPANKVDFENIATQMRERTDVYFESDEPQDDGSMITTSKDAIAWLSNQVHGCPACILSALRQGKIYAFDAFNYKDCKVEYYQEKSRPELD